VAFVGDLAALRGLGACGGGSFSLIGDGVWSIPSLLVAP